MRYVPTLVFLDETGRCSTSGGVHALDALEKHWEGLGYDMGDRELTQGSWAACMTFCTACSTATGRRHTRPVRWE